MDFGKVGEWLAENKVGIASIAGSLLTGNPLGAGKAVIDMLFRATGETEPHAVLSKLQNDPAAMLEFERLAMEKEADIRKHQRDMFDLQNKASEIVTNRVASLEGTVADLKQMPFLGRLIIFLRGCQRPAWGFFTMYLDAVWFVNNADLSDRQGQVMLVINLLVLGFLFGERAIQNLEPVLVKIFSKA